MEEESAPLITAPKMNETLQTTEICNQPAASTHARFCSSLAEVKSAVLLPPKQAGELRLAGRRPDQGLLLTFGPNAILLETSKRN